MGRPALTEEQVRGKVLAYCERYHVSPGPEGLPPFPSGKRETRQHREWLTVYRAHQRWLRRSATANASSSGTSTGGSAQVVCPICERPLQRDLAILRAHRTGKAAQPVALHPTCADLARLAETLGPEAVAGVAAFLWPSPLPDPRGEGVAVLRGRSPGRSAAGRATPR